MTTICMKIWAVTNVLNWPIFMYSLDQPCLICGTLSAVAVRKIVHLRCLIRPVGGLLQVGSSHVSSWKMPSLRSIAPRMSTKQLMESVRGKREIAFLSSARPEDVSVLTPAMTLTAGASMPLERQSRELRKRDLVTALTITVSVCAVRQTVWSETVWSNTVCSKTVCCEALHYNIHGTNLPVPLYFSTASIVCCLVAHSNLHYHLMGSFVIAVAWLICTISVIR